MHEQALAKGLEIGVLQNLANASILMGLLASGLILAQVALYVCFPILILLGIWAAQSALRNRTRS